MQFWVLFINSNILSFPSARKENYKITEHDPPQLHNQVKEVQDKSSFNVSMAKYTEHNLMNKIAAYKQNQKINYTYFLFNHIC